MSKAIARFFRSIREAIAINRPAATQAVHRKRDEAYRRTTAALSAFTGIKTPTIDRIVSGH